MATASESPRNPWAPRQPPPLFAQHHTNPNKPVLSLPLPTPQTRHISNDNHHPSKPATMDSKSTTMNKFDQLVDLLRDALGESSGLTSDDVDLDVLMDAMARYVSNGEEWAKYDLGDASRGYTRNLVDEGNGKSNLVWRTVLPLPVVIRTDSTQPTQLVLVWSPGKGSPIHDHGNAHCIMKILRGNLTETRYDFPEGTEPKEMTIKSQAVHAENAVAYMADELGLHRVSNEGSDFAVSLHRG